MNKKGLIGKILLIFAIILLIIGIIIGITIYQGYKVYKVVTEEQARIEENTKGMQEDIKSNNIEGVCTRVTTMETSINHIKGEVNGACANPIIKAVADQALQSKQINLPSGSVSPNCDNIAAVYDEGLKSLKPIKDMCSNQTLMDQIKRAQLNATNSTA
jgi:hypothetical protein